MDTQKRIRDGPESIEQLSLIERPMPARASAQTQARLCKFQSSTCLAEEERSGQLSLSFPVNQESADRISWTDDDIRMLREAVLHDALSSVLDARNRDVLRGELWEWIKSDALLPFSFNTCAIAVGADPDDLRGAFERMVARAGKAAVHAA